MVLPTSFATSMLAWGMLTFGDVSPAASAESDLPAPRCGTVAAPCFCLCHLQLFLCAQSHCLRQPGAKLIRSCLRLNRPGGSARPIASVGLWAEGTKHAQPLLSNSVASPAASAKVCKCTCRATTRLMATSRPA